MPIRVLLDRVLLEAQSIQSVPSGQMPPWSTSWQVWVQAGSPLQPLRHWISEKQLGLS